MTARDFESPQMSKEPPDGRLTAIRKFARFFDFRVGTLDDAALEARLRKLDSGEHDDLLRAMRSIEAVLDPDYRAASPWVLRSHRPGDLGWVVSRHGTLYAREFGFDQTFESRVGEIAAQFLDRFDPRSDRCWIAEIGGERVGSVLVTRHSQSEAQMRLLLVERHARRLGLGSRLIAESIQFAATHGYQRIRLETDNIFESARRLCARYGFRCVEQRPHRSFGRDLVAELWQLDLEPSRAAR